MAITTKKIKNLRVLQFFDSMRFKMIATYFALILCTLALMSVYILGLLSEKLYDGERVDMFAKANIIADSVSQSWPEVENDDAEFLDNVTAGSLAGTNIRAVLTNSSYKVLYDTNTESALIGKIFMRDVIKTALEGEQAARMDTSEANAKMLSLAVPVKVREQVIGAVYLANSVDSIDGTIQSIKMSLVVFSILICALIGMLSLGMSYIITSPMEEFIRVAKEISKGDFSERVKVKGHSEIAQMGEALNYMCAELGHLEQKRRNFVSDASHELKTPMATIKLICDSIASTPDPDIGMVKEFLHDLSDEVDRLTRIVERLLVLTKLDSGKETLKPELVDCGMLLERIEKKLTPIAAAKSVSIHTEILAEEMQPVLLDYDKIWEAIYNVVDNAIKYSKIGGFVRIQAAVESSSLIIRIADEGPGIPKEYKERIFERFYRLDDSRARDTGGTGLGLSITKEAVVMHGGTITVEDGEQGGSVFVITLPYQTTTGHTPV